MTGLLLGALERVSPRFRRVVVAIGALLALGALMAALTLMTPRGGHKARAPAQHPAAAGSTETSPRRLAPPVSTAAMLEVRHVAARFLAGDLPFAYGRGSGLAVQGITPALRHELRQRAQLTPVERRRRPRVMSLQTIATTPAFVLATAVIDDGGVTTYRLRFTLQREAGRWAVSSVTEG